MNIVMLGHTGVGKTTYMASMYGVLQQAINGFSLRAENGGDHERLLRLYKAIRAGSYPPPDDQRSVYDFVLRYRGDETFPFRWVDYRGKALTERQHSAEAQQLISDIREADGLMLFCDAEALSYRHAHSNQIGRMTSLVGQAFQELEFPMPLVIVVTKADLVGEWDDALLKPLEGLIAAVQASQLVRGTLIPVACGSQLMDVHLPVLFALNIGIVLQAYILQKLIEQHYKRHDAYKDRVISLENFFRWLDDEPTYGAMAEAEAREAREKLAVYEKIVDPAQALSEYLQEVPEF